MKIVPPTSEELEEFNALGEEGAGEEVNREGVHEELAGEEEPEDSAVEDEDEIFFETLEEDTKVNEEDEKIVEQGVDYSRWALDVPPSRSTATADLVQPIERSPLRTEPAYRTVVDIVRRILEDIVSYGRENVLSYFDEYIIRLELNLKETFGIPQHIFLPSAYSYENSIRSHYINWKDAIEEYLHEFGTDYDFMEVAEMTPMDVAYEMGGEEDDAPGDKYNLPPDDFNEGGYKHFEDQKLEAKEPDYDEFSYVTLEQLNFAEEAGIGLPRHEQFEIHMALLRLEKVRRLRSVKFWGKIFGIYQNYFVAEAEMDLEDMKIEDLDELPEYPESEMVGDYDEEYAVEEEQRPVREMSESEWENIRMEYAEMYGEGYGENFPEIQLKEKPKPGSEEQLSAPKIEEEQDEDTTHLEEESEFELAVRDKRLAGKQTLKTYKLPPLPVIKEKAPKLPPIEDPGKGTNKRAFFVTNDPKSDWIRLPHVTPDQIATARQIRKFFTGYLSARIVSYPKFPGIEINLLRAQIARISAGTQVSPAGYFRLEEGEEAAEATDTAAGKDGKVQLNKEYEPLAVNLLTDPTCTFWVHHTEYILNQGRTVWYNVDKKEPKKLGEEEEAMMDEDEGEEGPLGEEVRGERGPPILTSCSEDLFMDEIPPWTVRPAIELAPVQGCVFVRSNLWPGSLSWTFGRKIGFIYVGWGVKAVSYGYTPPPPYPPRQEYVEGPIVKEKLDPTPAQEEEYRKKIEEWLAKSKKPEFKGEGEAEAEEENEEEEEEEEEE